MAILHEVWPTLALNSAYARSFTVRGVRDVMVNGDLSAWPNPTADVLNIDVAGVKVLSGELLNSAGQRVRSITLRPGRNAISVNGSPSGLYLLRAAEGRTVRVVNE